jgi:hypothetical protein
MEDITSFALTNKDNFHQIYINYKVSKMLLLKSKISKTCGTFHIYFSENFILEVIDASTLFELNRRYPYMYNQISCIKFHNIFNSPIINIVWPSNLKKLIFGVNFNQYLGGILFPKSLEYLELGVMFQNKYASIFPDVFCVLGIGSIKTLVVGQSFRQQINADNLPNSLQKIIQKVSEDEKVLFCRP